MNICPIIEQSIHQSTLFLDAFQHKLQTLVDFPPNTSACTPFTRVQLLFANSLVFDILYFGPRLWGSLLTLCLLQSFLLLFAAASLSPIVLISFSLSLFLTLCYLQFHFSPLEIVFLVSNAVGHC